MYIQNHSQNYYQEKYFKYKNKYLELKNNLIGAGLEIPKDKIKERIIELINTKSKLIKFDRLEYGTTPRPNHSWELKHFHNKIKEDLIDILKKDIQRNPSACKNFLELMNLELTDIFPKDEFPQTPKIQTNPVKLPIKCIFYKLDILIYNW